MLLIFFESLGYEKKIVFVSVLYGEVLFETKLKKNWTKHQLNFF